MPVKPRKPPFSAMVKHPLFIRGAGFGAVITATIVVYANLLEKKWKKSEASQEKSLSSKQADTEVGALGISFSIRNLLSLVADSLIKLGGLLSNVLF